MASNRVFLLALLLDTGIGNLGMHTLRQSPRPSEEPRDSSGQTLWEEPAPATSQASRTDLEPGRNLAEAQTAYRSPFPDLANYLATLWPSELPE